MKIGAVPYLNAKPLLWGLENEVTLAHPSVLHSMMHNGELDLALLPLFSFLDNPHYQLYLQAGVIQSRGPVKSVLLFYRDSLPSIEAIKTVKLTPDSKTSVGLFKVLSSFLWKRTDIQIVDKNFDAELLIGDEALLFNKPGYKVYDLGDAWNNWAKLPFTYAAWISNKPVSDALINKLIVAKDEGLKHRTNIAKNQHFLPQEACLAYLTENIYYDMNPTTMEGIALYEKHLFNLGLISSKRYT
ncbi:menaquinone biosynthesis protein [bacterium]|nr:menaquinone biosynthesis protein [bacterium]